MLPHGFKCLMDSDYCVSYKDGTHGFHIASQLRKLPGDEDPGVTRLKKLLKQDTKQPKTKVTP
jgi:hypothetical protein